MNPALKAVIPIVLLAIALVVVLMSVGVSC